MICINRALLVQMGLTGEAISRIAAEGDGDGFATSSLFSFDGGGNRGRESAVLDEEIRQIGHGVAHLLLVGMADRYGAMDKRDVIVEEICARDGGPRLPTPDEADRIRAALTALAPSRKWVADLIIPHLMQS